MKNKQLKHSQVNGKKRFLFKPEDCLNYIKANRRNLFKNFFPAKDSWGEYQDIEDDLRERYRI